MISTRTLFGLGAVLPIVLLVGCGPKNAAEEMLERQIEQGIEEDTGGSADVDVKDGMMRVKTDDGTLEMGATVSLPEGWPEDVAVYPEGKITYAVSANPADDKPSRSVMISTDDSVRDIASYFKDQLPADGWTMDAAAEAGSMTVLGGTKGDRRVTVIITESDGATSITLNVEG